MNRPVTGTRSLASLVLCLLLALATTACSGGDARPGAAPDTTPAATETVSLAATPVPTRARVARVYGRLPQARRKAVRRQVTRVVDRWWDAAYLGGTYPRAGFRAAFPGFTRGAEARARRDKRLMSNLDIGTRVDSVTARHRAVELDVLAVDRRARAVTARFVLRFATTGERTGVTVVRGRLLLTRRHGPWQVFGYDVSKGRRA
jgi:hypothetical protein